MIWAGQAHAARKRYLEMTPVLNEQSRRRFVALEAQAGDSPEGYPQTPTHRWWNRHDNYAAAASAPPKVG